MLQPFAASSFGKSPGGSHLRTKLLVLDGDTLLSPSPSLNFHYPVDKRIFTDSKVGKGSGLSCVASVHVRTKCYVSRASEDYGRF